MNAWMIASLITGAVVVAGAALRGLMASSSARDDPRSLPSTPMKDPPGDSMDRPPKLTETPAQWAARTGVDPALVRALIRVESNGQTGTSMGPIIRLENHHLIRRVQDAVRAGKAPQEALDLIRSHFRINAPGVPTYGGHQWRPSPTASWRDSHMLVNKVGWTMNQANEYAAIRKAAELLAPYGLMDVPYLSSSWGVGQVLGRYYSQLGYRSPREMWQAARDPEVQEQQMLAYLERVKEDTLPALRRKDLRRVVELYNGPGQVDFYMPKLAAAYEREKRTFA